MNSKQKKKNNFVLKSHAIFKLCFQCCLVWSSLHTSRKMILNIHALIVFLHFTIRWWISLSMPSLKIQFHTYLIRSSKQFLHFVIFNDACHQLSGKVLHATSIVLSVTTPRLRGCKLSQVCIYYQIFLTLAEMDCCSHEAPIMEHVPMMY